MNSTPIYKRLNITEEEYKDMLIKLYNSGISQHQIATKIESSVQTIENHFKKYGIPTRSPKQIRLLKAKKCNLSSKQIESLDGMLIADGHLERSTISSRIAYCCKFRETLTDIQSEFNQLHFCEPSFCQKGPHWNFKSSYYKDLLYHWKRWYNNNKIKIIPSDLKLTPKFMYWWFIGDGYIHKKCVILCTDNFNNDDLEKLIKLFYDNGMNASVIKSCKRIKLSRKSTALFINKIINSPLKIADQYKYKFTKNI